MHIVAMGGGGFLMEPENPLLDDFILSLARGRSPRVCFVPTASGDSENFIVRFFTAFSKRDCKPSYLSTGYLFEDHPPVHPQSAHR